MATILSALLLLLPTTNLPLTLPLTLLTLLTIYLLLKGLYRLTLHPLSHFPGPKTAALTRLHAIYYDLPYRTSYVKEFATYHDTYDSPIVRIEPNYLHVRDIDAYNEIFKVGSKFTREPSYYSFPATKGSLFNELGLKEGMVHRGWYTASFSRGQIVKVEPVVREHLGVFLRRLDEMAGRRESVDLTLGFRCLQGDTLMRFLYGQTLGALERGGFEDPMIDAVARLLDGSPVNSSYGGEILVWVFGVLKFLPRSWVVNEGMTESFGLLDGFRSRILELLNGQKEKTVPSMFQTAMEPKEKNQPRLSIDDLAADGLLFFAAGLDTVANALAFGTYHLVRRQSSFQRLRDELAIAIPEPALFSTDSASPDFPLSWFALEKLPYLQAVVKESIRMSFGVPGHIPRVVPPGGATLAGRFIPAGTVVSSTSYAYFSNSEYYVAPEEFRPERWIPDSSGQWVENNGVDPDKYFVAFTRGSRTCIGISLAYAQLSYTLAYMIRNFDITLDEGPSGMKDGDMDWHDAFAAATFGHLKVKCYKVET